MSERLFKLRDKYIFKISLYLINFSFLTSGIGNYFFKVKLPFDISTLGIYFLFFLQMFSGVMKINKFLLFLLLIIFIHTFLVNFNYISLELSFRHFLGLSLFLVTFFSFASTYRNKFQDIVISYFKLTLFVSYFSIIQVLFFVLFDISIIPQNIISGENVIGSEKFVVEMFGILPRSLGLSTEPANFSIFLLPSVYIATRVLFNRNFLQSNINFKDSIVIISAFLLSFSLVGYFGLFLIISSFIFGDVRVKIKKIISFIVLFCVLIYFVLQTSLGYKISSFLISSNDIANTEYTSSDQTSFALFSNLLVSKQALLESHYLGFGLNSHQISYTKNITNIFSVTNIPNELNKENAGSLFIRIISEFGIPGITFLLLFLFFYKCKNGSTYGSINELSLIFLLTYMFRTGHYISNIFIFFLAIYVYTKKMENSYLNISQDERY